MTALYMSIGQYLQPTDVGAKHNTGQTSDLLQMFVVEL